jgi:hypothetical protein
MATPLLLECAMLRLVTHAAAAIAAGSIACAAVAQPGSLEEWKAQHRAERTFDALSERYTQIWAGLSPAQKSRFSAQERAWLNEGRWLEQRACLAARGTATPTASADCLAEVTERHLQGLGDARRVLVFGPSAYR